MNIKKMFRTAAIFFLTLAAAAAPFAYAYTTPRNFTDFAYTIVTLANRISGLLFVIAFAGFLWGVVRTVVAAGDAEGLQTGKKIMLYGAISLAVVALMWGIVLAARLTLFGIKY